MKYALITEDQIKTIFQAMAYFSLGDDGKSTTGHNLSDDVFNIVKSLKVQEPVTNSDLYSIAGRLALELECLLLDTKDISIASKWWDSAHEALDQWRKFHLRACTELDSDEITKSCDSKPESDAMRLYQAVDRLATQAGEDAGETIDWLCGEHGGMSKLFEAYFSPKPIANPVENLEPVPVWLENDLAFKEIMKWVDPNDRTQHQFLPWIGERVLFCCDGVTYVGKHTGGSFVTGQGVTQKFFGTWDCHWMYLPEPIIRSNHEM